MISIIERNLRRKAYFKLTEAELKALLNFGKDIGEEAFEELERDVFCSQLEVS